ncbi:covalently-linked cell wall protein [Colletotrichum navitas]|uniref:Covalently-linked cell wall protein n=1 Tax=Colletotrichum navitas TaxID=681940 RepID=A0AAD8PK30_9PEZI|nr:covalently-linked cell wall protein [Colletotrichum navitas]KAK1566242.1 covalently-linked cell wall protein [Colletotrichum navitas]
MRLSAFVTYTMAGMALAVPQAVPQSSPIPLLSPPSGPPSSCQNNFEGNFGMAVVELGTQSLNKRGSCNAEGSLDMTLKDGVLTDSKGRIGSIVSNFQFQFDGPPQAGVIYTSGFSVCTNGSLALGGSTTFFRCLSGNFWNLYDRNWAEQCSPIHLAILPCGQNAPKFDNSGKQNGNIMVAPANVTYVGDGPPQVVATTVPLPVCQIGDGQIQAHTSLCGQLPPVTSKPNASTPAKTTPPPPAKTTPPHSVPAANTTNPKSPPGTAPGPVRPGPTAPLPVVPIAGGPSLAPTSFLALVVMLSAALYML